MTDSYGSRLLVPVEESQSLRGTVTDVVSRAVEGVGAGDAAIHFVYAEVMRTGDPHFAENRATHDELLDQVEIWARSDLEEATEGVEDVTPAEIDVVTASIGASRYLFAPSDYADVLGAYAEANDLGTVVLDPGYNPVGNSALLSPLEAEFDRREIAAVRASVDRPARRGPFPQPRGALQFLAIFGVSYLFYLTLAWFASALDFVTGAIGAAIVGVALSRVSLTQPLRARQTARRLLRFVVYVPYLLWEVTKANIGIARVILSPRMPIDPSVVRFRAAVWGGVPVTTLANSITLTPGTLTIDVGNREFIVHSLTIESRRDLLDGALERAVRFVFWGRTAARIPSPRERKRGDEDE
jgi:multicomponent Na+:H+ antiporter subunit E